MVLPTTLIITPLLYQERRWKMLNFWPFKTRSSNFISSELHDETTFYKAFIKDLKKCKEEVIIESPFIACQRMSLIAHIFDDLVERKIKVYVITRDPEEHDLSMRQQAEEEIRNFEMIGVQVLITSGYHHRKLAIIDRKILWEGSLNILSQSYSREIMRRITGTKPAKEMFKFLKLEKFIY